MGGGQRKNPAQQELQPGLDIRYANAAGTPKLAQRKRKHHNGGARYCITSSTGDPFRMVISGRDRWTLEQLRQAWARGCTPIHSPAPRWSAYIFNLRKLGVEIETITEAHGGDFPGHQARYVLRDSLSLGWKGLQV